MKRFRQLCLLSLCLLGITGLLGACGRAKTTAKSPSRVTITFWHGMTDEHQTALNHLITQFNRSQTTYRVVGSGQGNFTTLQQKITAAAKAHTLPTISQTTYTNVPDYHRGNFIAAWDATLPQKDLAAISPAFRQSSRYQGKTYAIPFSKSTRVLYYNRQLLKQLNLAVPTTWRQLRRESQLAQQHGITGLALDQGFVAEFDDLARQAKSPLVTRDLRVNIDTPKSIAAAHVIWDMLQEKTARTAGTDGYGSTQFFAGKTLFYSGSSAAIPIMRQSAPKNFRWGTAILPSYHGRRSSCIAGNDIVLFKSASSAQRKGAAAFMRFLIQRKQTTYWAEKTGYLPLTGAAQRSAEYQRYLRQHPDEQAALSALKYGQPDPAFLGYPQYLTGLTQAIDQMTANHVTPERALKPLQKQVTALVK